MAGLTALALGRRCHMKKEDIILCGIYSAIGGLIGAKLGFILAHAGGIADLLRSGADWRELTAALISGGFVSFGGIIGGLIGFLLYCREFRVELDKLACCLIPAAPLLLACCRLGCFCTGCCYGIVWDGAWAIVNTVSPVGINGTPLFPVQLLACGLDLLLFCFMLLSPRLHYPAPGSRLMGAFLALYSAGRFGVEFLRGDHAHDIGPGLTGSQCFCLLLLAVGLYLWYRGRQRSKFADIYQ